MNQIKSNRGADYFQILIGLATLCSKEIKLSEPRKGRMEIELLEAWKCRITPYRIKPRSSTKTATSAGPPSSIDCGWCVPPTAGDRELLHFHTKAIQTTADMDNRDFILV